MSRHESNLDIDEVALLRIACALETLVSQSAHSLILQANLSESMRMVADRPVS
jgi:hypothetical protein